MRFIINGEAFTRQEARNGVIPMKAGFRALFLKESAAALLDKSDEWIDFDDLAQDADESLRRDLSDGLTLLECFDIAQVERESLPKVCRVAGERDYRRITAFLKQHAGGEANPSLVYVEDAHNEDAVRARQFNNQEYNFICEQDGGIAALLIVRPPFSEDVSAVLYVQHALFDGALPEETRMQLLSAMLEEAASAFRQDYGKMRYQVIDPCQERTLKELTALGFTHVCTLDKEMAGGTDLHIYDRKIGR